MRGHRLSYINAGSIQIRGLRVLPTTIRKLFTGRRMFIFLFACVLSYALEHLAEHYLAGEKGPSIRESIFNVGASYQRLVTSWPRTLVPRYTALVTIDPDNDPFAVSLQNTCEQRAMMADLLDRLAQHAPAVIVIDKYFGATTCERNPATTLRLRETLRRVSQQIPVIVGVFVPREEQRKAAAGERPRLHAALALVNGGKLSRGLVNLDVDSRKVAMGWDVLEGDKVESVPTIALQAALSYDTELFAKYPLLAKLAQSHVHPYMSMIQAARFATIPAGRFLCGSNLSGNGDMEWCKRQPTAPGPEYVHGRVVVLGELHAMDEHQTILGPLAGLVLQANYIEALLDERYFQPAPLWIDYLVGFFFFVAVELSLLQRNMLVSLLWVTASIAVTFVLLSVVARYLAYYVSPATFSVLVLALNLIFWIRERIMHKSEARDEWSSKF